MTDDNNNTLRAVFLAALMVLWVFAGTVAFAGGAAAVSDGDLEDTRVSVEDQSTGAQTDYTASTSFQNTNDPNSTNPSGVAAVELVFEDASEFGGNTGNFSGREDVNVTIDDPNAGQYGEPTSRTVPLQDTINDGDSVALDFQEKENVSSDAELTVQFENRPIQNPSVEDTYELEFRSYTDEGPSDEFESDTAQYEITGDGGDDADDRPTDAEFDGQATRWKGQILDFQAFPNQCNTDNYQLRYYTPDENTPYGTLIREITLNATNGAQIPTRNVADNERVVIVANDSNGNKAIVDVDDGEQQTPECTSRNAGDSPNGNDDWVEVIPQEFDTEFQEDAVQSGTNATLNVDSNRNGYDVYVASDDFSSAELSNIVEGASTNNVNSNRAPSDDSVRVNGISSAEELNFDFGGVDPGNYSFELSPVDTIPEDNSSIEVTEEVPGDAEFESDTGAFTVKRGDIQSPEGSPEATISVDTQGGFDYVVLVIGDEDRNNYETQVTAEPDDNGNVDIRMNTFLAGQVDEQNESRAYDAENGTIVDVTRNSPKLTGVLDEGQYDVTLEDTNGAELDAGVVNIRPSSYEDLTQLRHPDAPLGAADSVSELSENEDLSETGLVTLAERDRSNERDLLIHRANISGIYGALTLLASADDLESANGNQVLSNAQAIDPETDAYNDAILNVSLRQINFVQNTEPKVEEYEDPSESNEFRFVIDEDNETVYLVTDVRDLELEREVGGQANPDPAQIEPGDDFEFEFAIGPGFNETYRGGIDTYVPEGNTTTQLDTEDREATLGKENADRVRVEAKSNQTIGGQTNIAPGSNITIAVDSSSRTRRANDTDTSDLAPVFQRATVTVQEDGSFRASTFDFSDNEVNRRFSVSAQNQGFEDSAEKPGIVLGPANVSIEEDVTVPVDQDELASVTVDSVYLPDGGFVTIHDGSVTEGEVFNSVRGTSEYLEGDVVHENVVVELDDPYTEDGAIVPMAHKDTNNNQTYDFVTSNGEEDGPYTDGGSAVIAQASVTFEEETATPTDEPTDTTETATDEPTDTPTETPSEDQPGFGAVLALIALIGAALLAARRNDF